MLYELFEIAVVFLCLNVLFVMCKYTLSRIMNYRVWRDIKGRWIMVTGATDGIGKELAILLAKRGHNMIVLGRNVEKLRAVEEEIVKYAKCRTIQMDLSAEQSFDGLVDEDIGMLINNAGVSSEYTKYFVDDERNAQIVMVNNLNTIKLTQCLLKQMKEHSYIINIGSKVADFPCPLHSVYAASKCMIKSWSVSLSYELSFRNIHVEYVSPNYVATKMSKIRKSSFFVPSAYDFANAVVMSVGCFSQNTPYFSHVLQNIVLMAIPDIITGYFIYRYHNYIRGLAESKKRR